MASSSSSKKKAPLKPTSTISTKFYKGFRSKQEFEWWEHAFAKRPVVIERPALIDTFTNFAHYDVFAGNPGWIAYFARRGNICNITICSQFMASLIKLQNLEYTYEACVRKRIVLLNLNRLGDAMGIPALPENGYDVPYNNPDLVPSTDELGTFLKGGAYHWTTTYFPKNQLAKQNHILWLLIANCILPTSHTDKIDKEAALIMHGIATRKRVCLVRLFLGQIASAHLKNSKKDTIKMGVLITRLCLLDGVEENMEDVTKMQREPVDKHTQKRAAGQLKNRPTSSGAAEAMQEEGADVVGADGEGIPPGQEEQEAPPQVPRQRRRTASGAVPMDMDALMESINAMSTSMREGFERIEARQTTYDERQESMGADIASIKADMEYFRSQFPPPPDM